MATLTLQLHTDMDPVSILLRHLHIIQNLKPSASLPSCKTLWLLSNLFKTVKINFRQTFKRKRKSFWRSCQHSQLWHWQEEGFRRENPPQTIHLSSYATLCTNWHNLGRQEDRPTTAKYLRLVPRTSQDRMQSTLHTLTGRWFITGLQIIIQIKHAVPSILALFIIV